MKEKQSTKPQTCKDFGGLMRGQYGDTRVQVTSTNKTILISLNM